MTRLKLISRLAIAAFSVALGQVPIAADATGPQEEGEVTYLPIGEQPEWLLQQGRSSGLRTNSAAGEVTTSQFGMADALISNANGMLSVRFDPPFNAPYTITGLSFPTRTQFQIQSPIQQPVVADGSNVLTTCRGNFAFSNLAVGVPVSGFGIPAGTHVLGWTPSTVTISNPVAADVPVIVSCYSTPPGGLGGRLDRFPPGEGDFVAEGVQVGACVSGPGIPPATIVTFVTHDFVLLSSPVAPGAEPAVRTFVGSHRTFIRGGRLVGVRVLGMNPTTGLPDKSIEYFQQRQLDVRVNGGMNSIPLSIAGSPGQTFFAVFQFPRPPASADTFPFLFTDRNFTDRGLYANSYTTDTNAVIRTAPATFGTFAGTAVFADQNLVVSMTCQLSGAVPMNAPTNIGLNLRDAEAAWTFGAPDATVLADGTPAGNTKTNAAELIQRTLAWGYVAENGAQSGKVPLPAVPGSGMQIWSVRGRATNGTVSEPSNVTITGPVTVVGQGDWSEDADEANGKDSDVEAAALTPPFVGRPETLWPAGDIDNYTFFAQPGQVISVTATPVNNDFRSDMSLVVNLLENNHDVIESQFGSAGSAVSFLANAPAPSGNSGSKALKRFFLQVYDRNGSPDDPSSWNRVLIPATYILDVDVFTPAANLISDDPSLSGAVGSDEFAFANAGSNPARGRATFSYVIPKSKGEASVKLRVYDVRGRLINTLVNGNKAAGTHLASWSGHDQRGNRVASGPYFARIDAGSYSRTVRIVMN